MRFFLLFLFISLLSTACTTSYYIVRHAEKVPAEGSGAMSNDLPLTAAGKERAEALKEIMKTKKIGYIFSTNTNRTKSTAEPTKAYFNLETTLYTPQPDTAFITKLRSLKKNTLVVGHSNTVDDIVNKLCGSLKIPADLKETEYDNLFVVKKKRGKMLFESKKYGKPSN